MSFINNISFAVLLVNGLILTVLHPTNAFSPQPSQTSSFGVRPIHHKHNTRRANKVIPQQDLRDAFSTNTATTVLLQGSSEENNMTTTESDQLVVGIAGSLAALVMIYSEFVLSQTGCGLPAGPLGLVGAVEGLSYLSVVGLGGYSIFQKVTTGSGLPAGKYGLLGLAEGLAFLALLGGVIVLGLQVTNYGYIPNAVPMEGGMCS